MNERVARCIREYDSQGWHRTGTGVDLLSARWLAREVENIGPEPRLEPFRLQRISPLKNRLEVDGDVIEGLPLFDGGFTESEGIEGNLGPLGSEARIGVTEVSPLSGGDALEAARRTAPHTAVLAVTLPRGSRPGLVPRNAPAFSSPFGPPVLQIASEHLDRIVDSADRGVDARLVAEVGRVDADAHNVVTTVRGRDASLAPVIVMTPRSGWWSCAAERGGGIACWLEMVRAIADNPPLRNVTFVATSGHELGHLGLKSYLRRDEGLARGALCWIHLGASIGAAEEPDLRLYASDVEMQNLACEALSGQCMEMPSQPLGNVPGGESKEIHELGGRYISLAGGHATFHQQEDRWPRAVDVDSVISYATSMVSVLSQLSGGP